jgi:endo-1,4-beta-mannosidase
MKYHKHNLFVKPALRFLKENRFVLILTIILMTFTVITSAAEPSNMQLIETSADGRGFIERVSGRPYIVFGTNYYDPNTGWAPKIWRRFDPEKVRLHFHIMNKLGINCARVFLTAGSFQPTAETIDEQYLKKLDTLIQIARQTDIRLLLTGPDHWEGQPPYWKPDRFASEAALQAVEQFWEVIGRRYRGEPAIFAWDLLNEPHLPWFIKQWRPLWNKWLQQKYENWDSLKAAWGDGLPEGEQWDKLAVPENKSDSGNPRLNDWQLFREHLADQWVRRQVEALRRADPTHLITVGYIQWSYPLIRPGNPGRYSAFNPHRQVRWLDFQTIHFYPTLGNPFDSEKNWVSNLNYLQAVLAYCHTSKPVLLGEYGWYGGGAPQNHPFLSEVQQSQWLSAEVEASLPLTDGWLSWPFADSPDSTDISKFAGLVKADMTMKVWGHTFSSLATEMPDLKRSAPDLPKFDFPNFLTADSSELSKMHQKYVKDIQKRLK